MKKIAFVLITVIFVSCKHRTLQMKFDRVKWWDGDVEIYPYRDAMLNDLLKHNLKGMTYKQLTKFVGEPNRWDNNIDSPYYPIITDYGSDIAPVYTKSLVLYLNKDSIITRCKVEEWKKSD